MIKNKNYDFSNTFLYHKDKIIHIKRNRTKFYSNLFNSFYHFNHWHRFEKHNFEKRRLKFEVIS